MIAIPLTEQEQEFVARTMRDSIMECTTGDTNWDACREFYLRTSKAFAAKLYERGIRVVKTAE